MSAVPTSPNVRITHPQYTWIPVSRESPESSASRMAVRTIVDGPQMGTENGPETARSISVGRFRPVAVSCVIIAAFRGPFCDFAESGQFGAPGRTRTCDPRLRRAVALLRSGFRSSELRRYPRELPTPTDRQTNGSDQPCPPATLAAPPPPSRRPQDRRRADRARFESRCAPGRSASGAPRRDVSSACRAQPGCRTPRRAQHGTDRGHLPSASARQRFSSRQRTSGALLTKIQYLLRNN